MNRKSVQIVDINIALRSKSCSLLLFCSMKRPSAHPLNAVDIVTAYL